MRSSISGSRAVLSRTVVPAGEGGRHHRVLGAHDRHRRKLERGAAESLSRRRCEVVAVAVHDGGTHLLQRRDVKVHGTPADAIATGVGQDHSPESGQHRPQQDEAGAHLDPGLERDEWPGGLDRAQLQRVAVDAADLESDVGEQLPEDGDIADLRDVAKKAGLIRQDGRRHFLQDRVLGAGDAHLSGQRHAAGDDELLHGTVQSSARGCSMRPRERCRGRCWERCWEPPRSGRVGFLPLVAAEMVAIAQADATAHVA